MSAAKAEDFSPVSILMFCAATVWLCPYIELIVRGETWGWPWGGTPIGSCIRWWAGAALLHFLHTCQVPWVKLGAEHDITKASLHCSELWPLSLPSLRFFVKCWSEVWQRESDMKSEKQKYMDKKYKDRKMYCVTCGIISSEITNPNSPLVLHGATLYCSDHHGKATLFWAT